MSLTDRWQPPSRVAVGSTNPAKVEAVRAVISRLAPDAAVVGIDVPSGVPVQPVGADETRRGARQRAAAALAATSADLALGLEGGVEFDPSGCWLINQAAAMHRSGAEGEAQGLRLRLPPAVAAELQSGRELGDIMDSLAGRQGTKTHAGAAGLLTDGAVNRRQMWEQAAAAALAPLLHPELYPATPTAAPPLTRDFTVATFVVHAGRVLLLWHRKLQMWLPPGGHIDPHELPDAAAVREVQEETGLRVELTSLPAFGDLDPAPGERPPLQLARPEAIQLEEIGPGHQHIDLVYFARLAPGATPALAPNLAETGGAGWYGPEALTGLPLTAEIRHWCARALASAGR